MSAQRTGTHRATLALLSMVIATRGAVAQVASPVAAPAQTKGQSVVELGALDLTDEIDSVAKRSLRLRRVTLEPGGVIALHSHKDRPAVIHILQGSVVWHSEGKPDYVMSAGDTSPEGRTVNHWAENRGSASAVWIAADIAKQ